MCMDALYSLFSAGFPCVWLLYILDGPIPYSIPLSDTRYCMESVSI